MTKQIKEILEKAKSNEGANYYGVNYYRGSFYQTSVGAVKKISQKQAAEIIESNLNL